MSKTIITIKTWRCTECNYVQDFEPTQELTDLHHPGTKADQCPSCKATGKLTPETRPEEKTIITIMGEEEVDELEVRAGEDVEGKPKFRKLNVKEKADKVKEIRDSVKYWQALED